MKQFGGWQFPDGEEHLIEWMGKSNTVVKGRLSYQYNKIEMALGHIRNWRRAVDVGSHIGLWADHLAPRFENVEAFEPMPEHQRCFAANVTAANVKLHPVALGSGEGVARMTAYPGNSGHSHVATNGSGLQVPLYTLDGYAFEAVDFIKIDTEGYELEILRGAIETLKRCRPTLIVEQKANNGSRYGYDDRAALPFLDDLGYRVVAERARDYVLVWR